MNRETRRKKNKQLRKKLTDKQYKDLLANADERIINEEVDRQMERVITHMCDVIFDTLRANKISERRATKILKEIVDNVYKSVEDLKNEKIS